MLVIPTPEAPVSPVSPLTLPASIVVLSFNVNTKFPAVIVAELIPALPSPCGPVAPVGPTGPLTLPASIVLALLSVSTKLSELIVALVTLVMDVDIVPVFVIVVILASE